MFLQIGKVAVTCISFLTYSKIFLHYIWGGLQQREEMFLSAFVVDNGTNVPICLLPASSGEQLSSYEALVGFGFSLVWYLNLEIII